MTRALIRLVAVAAAVWVAAAILPGVHVKGDVFTYLGIALIFSLVNLIIGNLVRLLTMPITLVTFGISLFFVNAAMFLLTDHWSDSLTIDGFWWAFAGAFIVSVVSSVISRVLRAK
ncbi:MAG: phage holin family protein [Candidatus Nanopelagicales bacterium]